MTQDRTILSRKYRVDTRGNLHEKEGRMWVNVFHKRWRYIKYMDLETKIGLSILGGVTLITLILTFFR